MRRANFCLLFILFSQLFQLSQVEVTIQRIFLVQTQRRRDAEFSFLEFNGDLENKTPYERFEVYHWLTCRPKLCILWILSVEWKDSLRLCVSAFIYNKSLSLNSYIFYVTGLKFHYFVNKNHQQVLEKVNEITDNENYFDKIINLKTTKETLLSDFSSLLTKQELSMDNIIKYENNINAEHTNLKTKNAELTIAVNRNFKNAEGIYETDFIPCKLWNGVFANTIECLQEGDVVGVKGRLQSTEDKAIEIIADRITFLSSKSNN